MGDTDKLGVLPKPSINRQPIAIAEVFGPTIQGEGPSAGQPAIFVRTGFCNLKCTWCDTPYTWDWTRFDKNEEVKRLTVHDVATQVLDIVRTAHGLQDQYILVITGGEPMMQSTAVAELLLDIGPWFKHIEIETNGTLDPGRLTSMNNVYFNVSPKLRNSGNKSYVHDKYRFHHRMRYKFVVSADTWRADLDEVAAYAFDPEQVWIMPEGTDKHAITYGLQALAPAVIERGWNLTGRMHTLIWGDERGH